MVDVFPDILQVLTFEAADSPSRGELMYRACREVEPAWKHKRRAGRPNVYLLGAVIPKLLYRKVLKLCPSDYRIFTNDDAVTLDNFPDGYQFHLCYQVASLLCRRCVASAIARGVFNQRSPKGLARFHRVT